MDLGHCPEVGDASAVALAFHCPRLASLGLSATSVGDAGLHALADAAAGVASLTELRVDGCAGVSDDGVLALLRGRGGTRLRILIFHNCPGVTERSRQELEGHMAVAGGGVKQLMWTVY